tara:strand:+ start:17847 stop:18614 length:768 start_codon:yes stop_codon:yes gene_type:complete
LPKLEEATNIITANIDKITFNYGKRKVFDNFSLQIPHGLSLGLLGGNGSGKTTLMKLIAGLEKPNSGSISIFGVDSIHSVRSKIGYMPQQNTLYSDLSVSSNIDFFACMYGLHNKIIRSESIDEVLNTVGLYERKKDAVSTLSGGMQRRVSLACVLVHKPDLLLLDEPTVGLDPDVRVMFWEYFQQLTDQGITLFITSHTMDDAMHCDRLVFIKNGNIIAEDSPQGLIKATGNTTATLEDSFIYFNSLDKNNDLQ